MRLTTTALAIGVAAAVAAGCKFPYPPDVPDDDAAAACTPSTTTCADDTLVVCDDEGHPSLSTACAFGCAQSADRCGDLAPSNGLGMYLDQARTAAPLVLSGDATIDTTTGQITMGGTPVVARTAIVAGAPVEILVIIAKSFECDNVTTRGTRALAIVVDGDVRVHGNLSVSAAGGTPGAGGGRPNDPMCTARRGESNSSGFAGAGGGGYGSPGGRGGDGSTARGGVRGEPAGNVTLVPLRGGCPGAQANGQEPVDPIAPHGGGAGGTIQVSARGRIILNASGKISAGGGGGHGLLAQFGTCGAFPPEPPTCDAGSGGGSGGGILLEAADLVVPTTGALTANGGGWIMWSTGGRSRREHY